MRAGGAQRASGVGGACHRCRRVVPAHGGRRAFAVTDEDGSLPHEALLEIPATGSTPDGGGALTPKISVQLFEEGDAHITVDGVTFHDLPREATPAFLEALFDRRAHLKRTWYPPFCRLVVSLDDELSYKEVVPMAYGGLSRWLNSLPG